MGRYVRLLAITLPGSELDQAAFSSFSFLRSLLSSMYCLC